MILQTMLTTQLPVRVLLTFPLSFLNSDCHFWIPTVISTKVFNWFGNNNMKANPGKCHFLLSNKSPEVASINGIHTTSSNAEILLGITIDSELNFENHLSAKFNKVSRIINVLERIANYMSLEKPRTVMKTFIESQFHYCPLNWMFDSCTINNRINRLHERALRIVYSDFKSSTPFQYTKETFKV